MKTSLTLLGALLVAASSSAMAWESGSHSTSASVALSTDYAWRGYSQTDEEAAISGSFDYGHANGFYAGLWGSNIDFGSTSSVEVDLYAGFASEIGATGLSYDVGVLRYMYPSEGDINWTEYYASLSYSFLTAFVGNTTEYGGGDETATYYNLSTGYDFADSGVSLAAAVGRYIIDGSDNYTDWSLSASKELVGLGFDLSYIDTNVDNDKLADSRLVFTVSKSM